MGFNSNMNANNVCVSNNQYVITRRATASLPVASRGLTRVEAAAYVGLSPSAFYAKQKEGLYPRASLPGGRYDRKLLDQAMDRLSGLDPKPDATVTALDQWRKSRGSGSA